MNPQENSPRLVKSSLAANQLGITLPTFHAWRRRGYIHTIKLPNGCYAVPVTEIERLCAKEREQ